MTGTKVCNYRILQKLGEGGMGAVYCAEDVRLGRYVAVKFLSATLRTDAWARHRFCQEARAAAAVDHPNVCRVYDLLEAGSELFLVMALLEGRDLGFYARRNRLWTAQVLQITAQVADGLAAAHRCGVIHLDIKPSNIIVVFGGRPVIIDFGLASGPGIKLGGPEKTTAGTVAYMSPEQIGGEVLDCRADIWSLGVVLYELLSGHLPFRGEYRQATVYSVVNEDPEPLVMLGESPEVCSRARGVVGKALAKKPSERYSSAEELAADLRALSRSKPTNTSSWPLNRAV